MASIAVPSLHPNAPAAAVVAVDGACPLSREEIGAKAWGVNRMRWLGLAVPAAFVVTTHACREYYGSGRVVGEALWAQVMEHLRALEAATGRRFGAAPRPLLVSVRSGAAHSMPGMMDTVLNLGINADVEAALAAESGDARYAADTHRRFAEQYRKVVMAGGEGSMPADARAQLRNAIAAVFDSWHSPRAQAYRRNRSLPEDGGTAVMIQAMVFGNMDARSGTGVLFSRNPMTGEPPAWGEWLPRAQGEEVVSGQFTPQTLDALRAQLPAVHAELTAAAAILEADARDIQDIEFTVESGRLWLLQTRNAKRSPEAALHAAVAFAEAGLISREEAVRRLDAEQARQLPARQLDARASSLAPLAICEPACPGIASGVVVTDPTEAEARAQSGEGVILARRTTSPDDLRGIIAARGVATEIGGATSHAAVVSRELGRPCVVGCGANTVTALAGARVTIDGSSGRIWAGNLISEHTDEAANSDVCKLIDWGLPLISLRLLRPEQAPADMVDLDASAEAWRAALKPGITVRGRVLETDAGIRAARDAGVAAAVVCRRLPALLACLAVPAHVVPEVADSVISAVSSSHAAADLDLLRLAGLKGHASIDILADALQLPTEVAAASYLHLCEQGLCAKVGGGFRLTAEGQSRVASQLAEERGQVSAAAVAALFEDFCLLNAELKQIMAAWQLRSDGRANDHMDAAYDASVLKWLAELHVRALPFIGRVAQLSPRMGAYGARLSRAAEHIADGDHRYVARIIADSYHTVWFELHEDLIALAGRTRADEPCAAQAERLLRA